MTTQAAQVRSTLARLRAAAEAAGRDLRFMEVCGTHTMSAFRCGLHSLMPDSVTLLSGPGCPVCVTAQGDIDHLIELASVPHAIICTYGDMLRVPGRRGSLEQARAAGAHVRTVFSSLDALALAHAHPDQPIIFGAVGFETTAPATAALLLQARARKTQNLYVLATHKCVVPAMRALLNAGQTRLNGFLCPGHVSVIIGAQAYQSIVSDYHLPCVIAGFEPLQMAQALTALTELARHKRPDLINLYPEAVTDHGNSAASALIHRVFEPASQRWRGLGTIPQSGLTLRDEFRAFDAAEHFQLPAPIDHEPPGCRCGEVITGRATPAQCPLFAAACTPTDPIGPCMVSSEGTCQAWFKYRRPITRSRRATTNNHASELEEVTA